MILRSTAFAWSRAKLIVVVLLLLSTVKAAGQQRPPRDTTTQRPPGDTTQVAKDTIKPPPPILARHVSVTATGPATGVWEWTSEDLLREGAITLTDLLQQLPGVLPIRTGLFLQPEVGGPLGQTRGRIQIFRDGYELDPLTESSVDLSRIELADLRHVRVERRLDLTRIDLLTLEPTDGRPQSRVEAGVGEPDVNLFRGVLLAPRFLIGPLGFAIERIDTDGYQSDEPADDFAGWVKWAWIRGRSGIQAEFRQITMNRGLDSPWPGESERRDWVVRGRAAFTSALVGELFGGYSTFRNDTILGIRPDSLPAFIPEANVVQWGARASFDNPFVWADASVRFRDQVALPSVQVDGLAGIRVKQYGAATAALSYADWREAGGAALFDLRAHAGPLLGLTAFAELASGKRGGPSAQFTDSVEVVLSDRSGARLGLAVDRWGVKASAALIRFDNDPIQSFGLPFDSTNALFTAGSARGWEFTYSVPLYFRPLTLQGHYTVYRGGVTPIYLPSELLRVALQLHTLPLKSGNLELLGRIELRQRGEMLAPELVADSADDAVWETGLVPGFRTIDAYVQIRVMDVRLFLRADNITNQEMTELPDRFIRTPRYMYGVKWNFWN